MPQLEKYAFFSQIFWFSLTFFAFFVLLLQRILPAIARNLKFRNKLLTYYKKSASAFQQPTLAREQAKTFSAIILRSKNYVNRLSLAAKATHSLANLRFYKTRYFSRAYSLISRNTKTQIKRNKI